MVPAIPLNNAYAPCNALQCPDHAAAAAAAAADDDGDDDDDDDDDDKDATAADVAVLTSAWSVNACTA